MPMLYSVILAQFAVLGITRSAFMRRRYQLDNFCYLETFRPS